jgi:hypothetical protein
MVPGPGNYTIDRNLGNVSYSFGLKGPSSLTGNKFAPGPGAYSLMGSFVHIPGSKMGRSIRDDDFKKAQRVGSPGPGAYRADSTIAHSALKLDAPKFGFGTQDRNKLSMVG